MGETRKAGQSYCCFVPSLCCMTDGTGWLPVENQALCFAGLWVGGGTDVHTKLRVAPFLVENVFFLVHPYHSNACYGVHHTSRRGHKPPTALCEFSCMHQCQRWISMCMQGSYFSYKCRDMLANLWKHQGKRLKQMNGTFENLMISFPIAFLEYPIKGGAHSLGQPWRGWLDLHCHMPGWVVLSWAQEVWRSQNRRYGESAFLFVPWRGSFSLSAAVGHGQLWRHCKKNGLGAQKGSNPPPVCSDPRISRWQNGMKIQLTP